MGDNGASYRSVRRDALTETSLDHSRTVERLGSSYRGTRMVYSRGGGSALRVLVGLALLGAAGAAWWLAGSAIDEPHPLWFVRLLVTMVLWVLISCALLLVGAVPAMLRVRRENRELR